MKFTDIEKEFEDINKYIEKEFDDGKTFNFIRVPEIIFDRKRFESFSKDVQFFILEQVGMDRLEFIHQFKDAYCLLYTIKYDKLQSSKSLLFIAKEQIEFLSGYYEAKCRDYDNEEDILTKEDDLEAIKWARKMYFPPDNNYFEIDDDLCMDHILWRNGKSWKEYLARDIEDEKLKDYILNY